MTRRPHWQVIKEVELEGSIRNFCLDLTLDFPIIRFGQSPNLRTGEMWPQAHLSKADGRKTGGKEDGRSV